MDDLMVDDGLYDPPFDFSVSHDLTFFTTLVIDPGSPQRTVLASPCCSPQRLHARSIEASLD